MLRRYSPYKDTHLDIVVISGAEASEKRNRDRADRDTTKLSNFMFLVQ